ncbi:MAG: 4-hydroxy-tetrahydrodipicolinate synthase [Elusimicrobia bacterium]|nr:4-hydroxy-tetrahydrodipicolinate synthase [Elusimicrobiota bacterium]
MFSGSFVALITPFKKGRIDEKKLQELVEWHIAEKTSGLVPVGTTGESSTLSHEEHAQVIKIVVAAVKKRVPVIAGAGSNSTEEAISLSQEALKLGVDAVLSVNPYYNRPTQEGLVAHFSAIAKAASVPVILYNIPSRTGVSLSVDTIVRLAEKNKNIVGIKESTGSIDQTSEIIQRMGRKFFVLSGDDSLTLPLMSVGAVGVISVAANLVPKSIAELVSACLIQDFQRAQELHLKLFPLIKSLFLETNPAPLKAAMKEAKLIQDESLRLPLVTVRSETRQKIKAAMRGYSR